jgi:hypothetical protein
MDPSSDVDLSMDPTTRDRHGYAGGNPVGFVDVDGHMRRSEQGCSSERCHRRAQEAADEANKESGARADGSASRAAGSASIGAGFAATVGDIDVRTSFNIFEALGAQELDGPFYSGMTRNEILEYRGSQFLRASRLRYVGGGLKALGVTGAVYTAHHDYEFACQDGSVGTAPCEVRGASRAGANFATVATAGAASLACGGPEDGVGIICGGGAGMMVTIFGVDRTNQIADSAANRAVSAGVKAYKSSEDSASTIDCLVQNAGALRCFMH